MLLRGLALVCSLGGMAAAIPEPKPGPPQPLVIKPNHPHIWYHGRWDTSRGTWWTGSGFKLFVDDLDSLTLTLGPNTTQPSLAVGVSVNYEPFVNIQLSQGVNYIPGVRRAARKARRAAVRINVQGWQNNRLHLESITLNAGAKLLPYKPSKLAFQFIGDSLSSGQYVPGGVDGAWPFLAGEYFKAEHNIQAQPGACLTDQFCYGNAHGVSYQYFKTEDTGYYYSQDHNYTTDWDFKQDLKPTHIFIHIGANDSSHSISGESLTKTYLEFIANLRKLYPRTPLFVLGGWGWPSPDGSIWYYYPGVFEGVVEARKALGDKNIYFIKTEGWQRYEDVYPDNMHPSEEGHKHLAGEFIKWLEEWGLEAEDKWKTLP